MLTSTQALYYVKEVEEAFTSTNLPVRSVGLEGGITIWGLADSNNEIVIYRITDKDSSYNFDAKSLKLL